MNHLVVHQKLTQHVNQLHFNKIRKIIKKKQVLFLTKGAGRRRLVGGSSVSRPVSGQEGSKVVPAQSHHMAVHLVLTGVL